MTGCLDLWMCNGSYQCVNEPCHQHDPDRDGELTVCPSGVNRTTSESRSYYYTTTREVEMYYCAEEDECKTIEVPCNGVCSHRQEIACEDGSKCILKSKIFDSRKDCADGSDEIAQCKGDINCRERLRNRYGDIEFRCLRGDEYIPLYKYCNGRLDCADGSDEECDRCPGLYQCRNGDLVCGNIPCNNTGVLECPFRGGRKTADLCQTDTDSYKCVMVSVDIGRQ